MTAMWAGDLADRAALRPGESVLDVACGTGVVARIAAERVGSAGRVAALDVNPAMLAVARSLPAAVDWYEGSALTLPFADAAFDAVLCQLGLQFFPERPAALSEMRRALVPGGRLALNVFGPIEHNPATCALAQALDRHVGSSASVATRTEHALADADALRVLVAAAGFRDVAIETMRKTVRLASCSDYVRLQLSATPLAAVVEPQAAGPLIADVSAALAPYVDDVGLAFPQEVHVVIARR